MKKLTEKAKLYFRIASRRELKKKIQKNKKTNPIKYQKVSIRIPKIISLVSSDYHKELCKVIDEIKRNASSNINIRVILDFSSVVSIHTSGMILLYAELDIINKLKKKTHFQIKPPIDRKCADVLVQLEFYQMLGFSGNRKIRTQHEDVIHWKFIRGRNIGDFQRWGDLGVKNTKIYRCASEAVENATYHGYLTSREDNFNCSDTGQNIKPWWMFTEIIDNVLFVAIADLGIGFSGSLKEMIKQEGSIENTIKLILNFFKKEKYLKNGILHFKDESDLIKRLVESTDTITRTQKSNRGKGLPAICDIVRHTSDSMLQIWSNTGSYCIKNTVDYANNSKTVTMPYTHTYKHSIRGTVLCWAIPLEGNNES